MDRAVLLLRKSIEDWFLALSELKERIVWDDSPLKVLLFM